MRKVFVRGIECAQSGEHPMIDRCRISAQSALRRNRHILVVVVSTATTIAAVVTFVVAEKIATATATSTAIAAAAATATATAIAIAAATATTTPGLRLCPLRGRGHWRRGAVS